MKQLSPRQLRTPSWLPLACCALMAVGCGGGGSETVQGAVTLDGSPLAGVYLTLAPKDQEIEGPFVGETDAEGRFTIRSLDGSSAGAPPGDYQLAMTTSRSDGMENSVPTPERVPAGERVRDLQVPAGGLPELKLELKSK